MKEVRRTRAFTDPILVHEPTKDSTPSKDSQIYDDIQLDRLQRYLEAPTDQRVEKVGWPETTLYLSTASHDARFSTEKFRDVYQYSFQQYLEQWHPENVELLDAVSSTEPQLDEFWRERVNDLRYGMKKDLDKYWVENNYGDFNSDFPKKFLLTEYEVKREQETIDEYAQSALEEFSETD